MGDDHRDFRVFVGPYVHSESDEHPFVIVKDGLIGVEKGKVIAKIKNIGRLIDNL